MSYFEVKTIKGHDYLYLRQSIRVGKKVIHKHVGYFGRVDGASRIASGETITQVRQKYQEPKREPKPKKSKKFKLPKGRVERETAGREKIDRSKEISDKERLLRKKKKKLKKFLRKKKLKKDKEPEKEFKFFPWD